MEFNFDLCIEYCIEGYFFVEEFLKYNLKVLVGFILICRFKIELKNKIWDIYYILFKNGVEVFIIIDYFYIFI